jgi:uncharacterized membrane protein YfcA
MLEAPLFCLLVGVLGAIFANSTGAGGGVVFVPLFHALGFGDSEAVATSFAIQSYGMTTGALAWTLHYLRHRQGLVWEAFWPSIVIGIPCSVGGLWLVTGMDRAAPASLELSFALFSMCLGAAILVLSRGPRERLRHRLRRGDGIALAVIAVAGGAVTAWLSVGVGEFLAFYLIARRYDVTEAVAVAVVVSAATVWSASPVHLFADDAATVWTVAAWSGPGAIVGAILARALALRLGALRLKRFFGLWLLIVGFAELI